MPTGRDKSPSDRRFTPQYVKEGVAGRCSSLSSASRLADTAASRLADTAASRLADRAYC